MIQEKGLTAPRVTPEELKANIASIHYFTAEEGDSGAELHRRLDTAGHPFEVTPSFHKQRKSNPLQLLTFCVLVLRNGFTVTGESACASPENFDVMTGRTRARQNAEQKIWPLMGYHLKQKLSEIG